jgi:hypothetical protein
MGAPYESIESVKETQRLLCSGEFPLDNWKFNPLQIWRPGTVNRTIWLSDFDMDWEKYGYAEVDNSPDQTKVYWKNQEMDYFVAADLCREFDAEYHSVIKSRNGNKWISSPYVDAWSEPDPNKDFIPKYKQKLLEIVKLKNH